MNINTKQLSIIKTAAAVICAMLLYPPYQIGGYGASSHATIHTGYAFLFDLPDRAHIDAVSLLVQWVGVCLVTALGIFAFNSTDQ